MLNDLAELHFSFLWKLESVSGELRYFAEDISWQRIVVCPGSSLDKDGKDFILSFTHAVFVTFLKQYQMFDIFSV